MRTRYIKLLFFNPERAGNRCSRTRVGTRPDQIDRPVGVGRVGDVTDRPDFRSPTKSPTRPDIQNRGFRTVRPDPTSNIQYADPRTRVTVYFLQKRKYSSELSLYDLATNVALSWELAAIERGYYWNILIWSLSLLFSGKMVPK